MSTLVQQGDMVVDGHLGFLAFLDVRSLELWEGVLGMFSMGQSGISEIFFDPLSRAVLRFLSDRLEPRIPNLAKECISHL